MRTLAFILFAAACVFSQTPPIEPGVSQELAKWRAAHYSDVRYKLNLTLEKMSPVLKGTMEIRVKVGAGTLLSPTPQGVGVPPIILDWRKIKGHEDKSTISNVSINGRSADTLVRMSVASTRTSVDGPQSSIDKDSFAGGTGDADKSVRAPFEEIDEHLIFNDGVVVGENVIKLDFTSPILTSGSAITRYVDKEDGAEYIYSLFVPSDASTAFPVFDQPDLKAKFSLNVVGPPADWYVVSNSAGEHWSVDGGNPWNEIWNFSETKPISTYVFAFAAGPFERLAEPPALAGGTERGSNSTSGKSGTLPPAHAGGSAVYVRKSQAEKFKPHAAEVFRLNREAIRYFEEYFDYKFPFPKYDLVLIPEFPFGGMEHAGATFLRESAIIFPQEPTKNDHISRAVLMFHEAAHQWFGDTVTMRWFDDLWLKEALQTSRRTRRWSG